MKDNFEVLTMTDKGKRDAIFEDMRANGDDLERQVVKFSSNEVTGKSHFVQYEGRGVNQFRPEFRSTWSVAYPKEGKRPKIVRRSVEGPLPANLKTEIS
jgi:hypothetical protein